MTDNNFSYGLDPTEFERGANKVIQKFKDINTNIDKIIGLTERYNAENETTLRTLTAVDKAGRRFSQTMKETADGLEVVGNSYRDTTAAANKLAQAQERLAKINSARVANLAVGTVRASLPGVPGNANTAEIQKYQSALGRLSEVTAKAGMSAKEMLAIFTQVQTGTAKAYTGLSRTVANAAQSVITANQNMGNAARQAANVIAQAAQRASQQTILAWSSVIRIVQAHAVYRAFDAIVRGFREGAQAAIDFEIQISQIRTLAQNSGNSFDEWSGSVLRLAGAYGADTLDVAKAFHTALSNQIGNNVADIERFTATTVNFAKVAGGTVEQANNLFSSAINSFGFSAADAEKLAAKFFKTIDLGRVTSGEMSASFGRLATMTAQVGMSLDETLASVTTLTRQGVNFQDSTTQITNLVTKLIKPTEAMKDLYKVWGVETGEAAIAAFGFAGVLERIGKEIETGGTARLGQLFTEIRGFRGAVGLGAIGLQHFSRDLAEIKDSSVSYAGAVTIAYESAGQKLDIELNKIKANFISAGQEINKSILVVTDVFGGLSVVVSNGMKLLFAAGVAYLTYKTVVLLAASVTGGFTAAMRALTLAMLANPVTAIAVGLAAIAGILVAVALNTENLRNKYTDLYASLERQTADNIRSQQNAHDQVTEKVRAAVDEQYRIQLESASKINAALTVTTDSLGDLYKSLTGRLREAFESDIGAVENTIQTIKASISKLDSEINASQRRALDFRRQMQLNAFESSIDKLSPAQKMRALVNQGSSLANASLSKGLGSDDAMSEFKVAMEFLQRAKEIENDLSREGNKLDADSTEHQRKKATLLAQQLRLKAQLEQGRFVDKISPETVTRRSARGKVSSTTRTPTSEDVGFATQAKAIQDIAAQIKASDLEEANRKRNMTQAQREAAKVESGRVDLAGLIAKLTGEAAKNLDSQVQSNQRLKSQEAEALARAEAQASELKSAYRDLTGFGKGKDGVGTLSEFDAIVGKIEKIRDANKESVNEFLTGTKYIQEQRKALELLLKAKEQQANVSSITKELADAKTNASKEIQASGVLQKARIAKIEEAKRVSSAATGTIDGASGPSGFRNTGADRSNLGAAKGFAAQVAAFNEGKITIAELSQAYSEASAKIDTAEKSSDKWTKQLIELIDQAYLASVEQNRLSKAFDKTEKEIRQTTTALDNLNAKQPGAQAGLLGTGVAAETAAQQLERLTSALDAAAAAQVRLTGDAATLAPTTPPAGFAHGGFVAKGTDTIPAMLSPGEYVINARQTARFKSTLQAINNGYTTSNNGGMSIDIGGIQVNTAGGGGFTSEMIPAITQEVAKHLERSLRNQTRRSSYDQKSKRL